MAYKTDTNGVASTIQTIVHNSLTTKLPLKSSFLNSGVTVVNSANPVSFPTLAGSFAVGFVGESEVIPVQDGPSFADVKLMPSTMKSIKSIIRLSEESLRESSIALDSILSARIVADTQRKLDEQAWSSAGDGTTTPKGILHATNVAKFNTVGLATADLSVDTLIDALGVAMANETEMSALRWVMTPQALTALRKVKTTDGNYLVQSDVTKAGGMQILGVPVTVTQRIASGSTMLFNASSWVVVQDLSPQVKVLSELFAGSGEVGLKLGARFDWGVLDGSANVLIKSKPAV